MKKMAEKTASDGDGIDHSSNNKNNNNNSSRRHAVMLFGADISSPPPPKKNNVLQEQQRNSIGVDIDIDRSSINNVEASSAMDGNGVLLSSSCCVNKAVGDDMPVDDVSFKRPRSKGKAVLDRNKGKAWTEDEHLKFLVGLKKFGKGNWRNISRDFVPTRTPMQVASHAQKHFVRQTLSSKKLRSSIFDMTLSEHAGVAPAWTRRRTVEAPSPTIIVPAADIGKEHPTPLLPYYLPVNPPLVAAATYGHPACLGISYPVGIHFDGKSATPASSTMLNHPWIGYYYPKCPLV